VAKETDEGTRVVVGVNKFTIDDEEPYHPLRVDPAIERSQAAKLDRLRKNRDQGAFRKHIDAVKAAAEGTGNVLPALKDALRADATLGEVCDALRDVWGVYRPLDVS
jgi:methylmalonyl-CoA mutase, N-terminal domain